MLKLVYTEWLSLDDVLILLPKSWIRCRTHCDHGLFPSNGPTLLYEDNTGAIALAQTGHFKGRSKLFDLRLKWFVDMMDLGLFKLDHVPSPDQHADIGTAPRTAPSIQEVAAAIYGRQITH